MLSSQAKCNIWLWSWQLFVYNPLDFKDLLGDELTQRKEEGYDNSRISELAERTLQFALANTDASRKE